MLVAPVLGLLFVSFSLAAVKDCSIDHTRFYNENLPVNPVKFFYSYTSPTQRSLDIRCQKITNPAFRKMYPVSSSIQVEHIVDTNNGPNYLSSCPKDILGNLVMATGQWNQQIGQLCWKYVEREKRLVYGDEIVDYALSAVADCCGIVKPLSVGGHVAIILCVGGIPALMILIHLFLVRMNYRPYLDKLAAIDEMLLRKADGSL